MSEEQLAALISLLKTDPSLMEKWKSATDYETAVSIAQNAGFNVTKADWLDYQANPVFELSDGDLEAPAGGRREGTTAFTPDQCSATYDDDGCYEC
jgi:predicted ribosomally synthesized peptide with nif11-like leader